MSFFDNLPLLIQILEQYFVRRNGKRAMTGDFDLAGNALLTTNLSLFEGTSTWMFLMDRAKSDFKNLKINQLGVNNRITYSNTGYLRSPTDVAKHLYLQSYDGAYQTVADIINGRIDIPCGGDITCLANKTFDWSLGNFNDIIINANKTLDGFYANYIIPRGAGSQAVSNSIKFDPTTNRLWIHNGAAWVSVLLS